MIEIDDSGSGSLIGGTCIALHSNVTNKFYHEIIPIELYNETYFHQKLYLDYVIEIVKRGFVELNATKDDTIIICQGYMFDNLRKWLKASDYNFENIKIIGALQDYVERKFEEYTVSLGFPKQYITYTKYPFHFHRILRWVYADYEKRMPLCKIGWESFKKYGYQSPQVTCELIPDLKYVCLKCGKVIRQNTMATVLRYNTNKPNIIYLHKKCYEVTSVKSSLNIFETPCSCIVTP